MTLCAAQIAEKAKNWPTEYIEQTGSYAEDTEMINVLKNFASENDARKALRTVAAANGDSTFQKGEKE